jgi:hypothetical protein
MFYARCANWLPAAGTPTATLHWDLSFGSSKVLPDTNGSKFANANQDLSRPDTLVNGQTRKVLLGHRVYQQGSDGKI